VIGDEHEVREMEKRIKGGLKWDRKTRRRRRG
jgi:hypothetical protein